MRDMLRVATLISGGGTTMQAIVQASKFGILEGKVRVVLVIASKKDAGGIAKAKAEGISQEDILVFLPSRKNPEAFGAKIIEACRVRGVDLIGQYGWMVKTPENVIEAYPGMMINQHPGPLDPGRPDFGGKGMFGLRVHCARLYFVQNVRREYVARDNWTEATAQRVAKNYDEGTLLRTSRVPIVSDDSPETLAKRVLPREHEVQIRTLQDFALGLVRECVRVRPLVLPGEEAVLEKAKQVATLLYPRG